MNYPQFLLVRMSVLTVEAHTICFTNKKIATMNIRMPQDKRDICAKQDTYKIPFFCSWGRKAYISLIRHKQSAMSTLLEPRNIKAGNVILILDSWLFSHFFNPNSWVVLCFPKTKNTSNASIWGPSLVIPSIGHEGSSEGFELGAPANVGRVPRLF